MTDGPESYDIAVRFTIRQMAIAIPVICVVLALAIRAPGPLVAGLSAVLVTFWIVKIGRDLGLARRRQGDEVPRPMAWFDRAMAILVLFLFLGVCVGLLLAR